MATLTFFPLMETEMIPGQMQRPITYVRGARDDFMAHDVKQPVSSNLQPQPSKLQCQAALFGHLPWRVEPYICFLPFQT